MVGAFLSRAGTVARVVAGRGGRDELKEHVLGRLLAGRDAGFVQGEGRRYADEVVAAGLRTDTVGRLRWHRDAGHRVVIVSASLDTYLARIAELLEVDGLLCSELEEHDGLLTGRLTGPNCRGAEKVRRLRAWLRDDDAELWAYGDSSGDDELLAAASHSFLIGRQPLSSVPDRARR